MGLITTAANEYYRRPEDERFPSPEALLTFLAERKAASREITYNAKDLRIAPAEDGRRIVLESPRGQAALTPWSHSQLCRMVGAPAGYVRTLPADIAAKALNHGITQTTVGTTAQILAQRTPEGVTARAITSESYGRLWCADLYKPILDTLGAHGWGLPPTWDGKPAGAYASDRDSFLVLVNGGSIVNDPSVRNGNGQMYRGVILRNSEVGAGTVLIDQILYEYVCGNHNFWGAVVSRSFRRRHVGTRVLIDTLREVGNLARTWVHRAASADEAIIRSLIDLEIASTKEAVIDELCAMGATKADAEAAYATCEQNFDASPRSFWGLAQGFTKASQASGWQDDRLSMDMFAGKLLAKGRQLVAA